MQEDRIDHPHEVIADGRKRGRLEPTGRLRGRLVRARLVGQGQSAHARDTRRGDERRCDAAHGTACEMRTGHRTNPLGAPRPLASTVSRPVSLHPAPKL